MQRKASRLKAMMIAFLSISLAIILCAAFYFYKIQQNEKYQNQLHFRELNNITVSLENGISAFDEFIKQQNKKVTTLAQTNFLENLDKQKQSFVQSQQIIQEERNSQLSKEARDKAASKPAYKKSSLVSLSKTMNEFRSNYEKLNSELRQAMGALQNEALNFLLNQRNQVEVFASVESGLIAKNDDEISTFIAASKIVENCLRRIDLSDTATPHYTNCLNDEYSSALKKVLEQINLKKKDEDAKSALYQTVYSQNSPLRNIASTNTNAAGLAKLQTDNQASSWSVPINDWLGGSNNLYPLVLLVNSKGAMVARKQNPELNSALVGIAFNDITAFLDDSSNNTPERKGLAKTPVHSTSRGVSKFIDVVISGNEYRIFISPFANSSLRAMTSTAPIDCKDKKNKCDNTFYIVGLREKAKFNSTKQTISRSIVAAAILFTLALVAFIPLLKIRLSSVTQAFSPWDRHTLAVGCVLLITVISVGIYDFIHYSNIKNEQEKLSKSLFMQMRNSFNNEVNTVIDLAFKNINDPLLGIANNKDSRGAEWAEQQGLSQQRTPTEQIQLQKTFKDYLIKNDTDTPFFIENLFILNGRDSLEESVKMNGLAMWGTQKRYRGVNNNISLESREYAVRAARNQLWPVAINKNVNDCGDGLFMERLFNLRDGGKSTQFAISCKQNELTGFYDSLSFGTQIQSFTNTVMPANYGFVVFDNKTGKALYHSEDDSRSLVENVFVETDNSSLLKAYMNTPYFFNQPTSIELDYNGKVHHFTLGTLKDGVPWTLVVFYDKENSRALNLMSILVTLTICFVVFVLVYYFVIMIVPKSKRRSIFWPTPAQGNRGQNLTVISILTSVIVFFGGLTLIISDHVFAHHQQLYQQINNANLGLKIKTAEDNIQAYRSQVLDKESVTGKPVEGVLCFLGTKDIVKDNQSSKLTNSEKAKMIHTCSLNSKPIELDVEVKGIHGYFDLLIEAFWDFSVLDGDIDETLVVTSQLNQTVPLSNKNKALIDNRLNRYSFERTRRPDPLFEQSSQFSAQHFVYGFLIIIAIAAFSLVLFKITKKWIFERFFGFNIPPFFRLNEKTRYDVKLALMDKFFDTDQYMMIVRPKLITQHYFDASFDDANNPLTPVFTKAPLIDNKIINFQTMFAEGETAEFMLDNLLASAQQTHPNASEYSIALSGLENTAFDEDIRRFALSVMEYLLALPKINVILLCEVAPLYRLTQPEMYPSKKGVNAPSSSSEMVRWSTALQPFIKVYDWCPNLKRRLQHDANSAATLIQEALAWPEMRAVLKQFIIFNKATHSESVNACNALLVDIEEQEQETTRTGEFAPISINPDLLAKTGINEAWIPEQIIEFFGANSGALYRFKWEQCTKTERIILFQIAGGLEPNPLNRGPLEHLVRRGYICRDKGWFIVNTSFKEFVLHAEPADTIDNWLAVANESIWQYLRIPFFAIVIALVAIMAYTATDAVETAIGVLSAVFALIPLAIKNFTAVKMGT